LNHHHHQSATPPSATLASVNINQQTKVKLMKSIITLSAITILAALALVGCNQSTPGNATDAPATNSSMSSDSGAASAVTNPPAISSVPEMNTNSPATNGEPEMITNAPAGTNQ
jgi:ABC-type oligopeptide transport system substrate-binding subunit